MMKYSPPEQVTGAGTDQLLCSPHTVHPEANTVPSEQIQGPYDPSASCLIFIRTLLDMIHMLSPDVSRIQLHHLSG